jgi:8-oxo-dGTP pyrophosphatase MutT (NUDIX family)
MGRKRIASSFFVFVVVEHEGHVLVVREAKGGQRWYAPAGGLEPGETIREAAIRETLEEAGVLVEPVGLIRVEQQWFAGEAGLAPAATSAFDLSPLASWWRFVLVARPVGSLVPKSVPDHHSLEARWVRPGEISRLPLRHPEVVELVALAERARDVVPLVA